MKRYDHGMAIMDEHNHGTWVRYDEASDLLQDERDKLARIERVAQVAYDNWPHDTFLPAIVSVLQICKDGTTSPITKPTGTEASVCRDIAERQQLGLAKYGTSVADNPLELRQWMQHCYEELLDASVYIKRAMEEMDK